ncbi:YlcG family protein [Enterobacteriaceae bacterium DFI.7.85]|nr:YlcG family protein [Enterobacteriaceae bacterium DFI.7.85]
MDVIRLRWQRLRIYRFRGSVVTDCRILRNYIKSAMRAAG